MFEGPSLGRQAATHGDALWERNPDLCCSIRKVGAARRRALGPRRLDHGRATRPGAEPRGDAPKLGWDERHELWKASPLADWSDDDVWAYIRAAGAARQPAARARLRFDRLHALHAPGDGPRGPLGGSGKTECGLHA